MVRSRARFCWRWCRRRRDTRWRCSSWTCSSTPTWGSTRSSEWRSSRRCRTGCPGRRRWARSSSARSAPSARSPSSSTARRRTLPCPAPGRMATSRPSRSATDIPTPPHCRPPVRCWRWCRRRRGTRWRCSSWTCSSTPTWGSTRSSGWRSSRRCRTGCPGAPAVGPEQLGSLRTLRQIAEFLDGPASDTPLPRAGSNGHVAAGPLGNGHPHAAVPAAGPPAADVLLEVVAEKTGYPVEMLELDMQLDADLGIDSIKRVEILSAMQDRLPGAPAVGPEQLGSLRTLRQIAEFLDAGGRQVPSREVSSSAAGALEPNSLDAGLTARPGVHLSRLVPRAVSLADHENRERLAISPGTEIWLTDDGSPLTAAVRSILTRRGHHVRVIPMTEDALPEHGDRVAGLIVLAPAEGVEPSFVKRAFRLIRTAGPSLRSHGSRGGAALMAVSRLDGSFGVEGLPGSDRPRGRGPGRPGQDRAARMDRGRVQGGRSRQALQLVRVRRRADRRRDDPPWPGGSGHDRDGAASARAHCHGVSGREWAPRASASKKATWSSSREAHGGSRPRSRSHWRRLTGPGSSCWAGRRSLKRSPAGSPRSRAMRPSGGHSAIEATGRVRPRP